MTIHGEQDRIAVVCSHPVPYFLARVGALAARSRGAVAYVALSTSVAIRDWQAATDDLPFPLIRLFDRPYHDLPTGRVWQSLREALESLHPTVVCVSGYDEVVHRRAARWAKSHGALSLTFWESWAGDRPRARWKEWLKRQAITRLFDGVFVGGERSQAYAESLGVPSDRIVRGYDVVDTPYFANVAADARGAAQQLRAVHGLPERYFVYAGRFSPEKNLLTLLRAYGAYRQAVLDGWALVMVGSGPQEHALKQLAQQLALPDVHWPGFQQLDILPRFYALGSCLILPSTSEPWGLVVNEAMASGLPVIVSDRCGCVPELLREGENGFLIDPWDQAGLTRAMTTISSGECDLMAMGRVSEQTIADYTPDTWAEGFLQLVRLVRSKASLRP